MRLDRSKPFGKLCPPENGVFHTQNGRYFGPEDDEVDEKGRPVNGKTEPVIEIEEEPKNGYPILEIGAAELLEQADTMHYQKFRKAAKEILGDDAPSLKADLITALKAQAKPMAAEKAPEAPVSKKKDHGPQVSRGGVDLVKWGTGVEKYLFGDVQKAIRELHHKQVDNARDAINFLIDQELVPAEIAINV